MAAIHVFHNCAKHACQMTNTKIVYQERVQTAKRTAEVIHTEPDDGILNLAQLTNAKSLAQFRLASRYPAMTRGTVITEAVEKRARTVAEAVNLAEEKKRQQEAKKSKKNAPRNPRKRRAPTLTAASAEASQPIVADPKMSGSLVIRHAEDIPLSMPLRHPTLVIDPQSGTQTSLPDPREFPNVNVRWCLEISIVTHTLCRNPPRETTTAFAGRGIG